MYWYIQVIKKYAQFRGRARRKEYWYFVLINTLISLVLNEIDTLILTSSNVEFFQNNNIFSGIYALALLIPNIAVMVRRLHDTDRSGWMILLALIPIIGWIVLFVFFVQDGSPSENRFGPNPKQSVTNTPNPVH